MPEARVLAALLLVLGPLLGLIPAGHPALIPVWSASRQRHLEIVAAHRQAWWALNAGFGVATVATACGLAILQSLVADEDATGGLTAAAIVYLAGGLLWCAMLAIRSQVTPLLGDLVAAGSTTEPAEAVIGAAQRGLFSGFVVLTCVALVVLGIGLLAAGLLPPVVALIQIVGGVGVLAWLLVARDVVPAVLYVPTLLIGAALLLEVEP